MASEVFVVVLRVLPRPRYALRVAGVTKLFGHTIALRNVTLECGGGRLLAVHGANGSGKSTLLRIIAALSPPTRGRVTWATDTPGLTPRIGFLGHSTHLFDELTAIENVTLAAQLAGRNEQDAIDLLEQLGVGDYVTRCAAMLSAGTRRRVGLARLLATDPDVMLADEPFAGLDGAAANLVSAVLAAARDEGRVVVIATHDDTRTRSIATDTVKLESGRVQTRQSLVGDGIAQ